MTDDETNWFFESSELINLRLFGIFVAMSGVVINVLVYLLVKNIFAVEFKDNYRISYVPYFAILAALLMIGSKKGYECSGIRDIKLVNLYQWVICPVYSLNIFTKEQKKERVRLKAFTLLAVVLVVFSVWVVPGRTASVMAKVVETQYTSVLGPNGAHDWITSRQSVSRHYRSGCN